MRATHEVAFASQVVALVVVVGDGGDGGGGGGVAGGRRGVRLAGGRGSRTRFRVVSSGISTSGLRGVQGPVSCDLA